MREASEQRVVAFAALGLAVLLLAWAAGWAVREANDYDPSLLEFATSCLDGQHGLRIMTPAGDPLADSAPGGAFRTTIRGNEVVVSIWDNSEAADEIVETYARLTPENLEGRAVTRGRITNLWAAPATREQAAMLYGCEP